MQLQLVAQSQSQLQSAMSSLTKHRTTASTATAAAKGTGKEKKVVSTSASSTGTGAGSKSKSSGSGVLGDEYDEEMGVDDTGHPHHRHYRRRDGVYSSLAGGPVYPLLPCLIRSSMPCICLVIFSYVAYPLMMSARMSLLIGVGKLLAAKLDNQGRICGSSSSSSSSSKSKKTKGRDDDGEEDTAASDRCYYDVDEVNK